MMDTEPTKDYEFTRQYNDSVNSFIAAIDTSFFNVETMQRDRPDEANQLMKKLKLFVIRTSSRLEQLEAARRSMGEESPTYITILSKERAALREFKSAIDNLVKLYLSKFANQYDSNAAANKLAELKADLIKFAVDYHPQV